MCVCGKSADALLELCNEHCAFITLIHDFLKKVSYKISLGNSLQPKHDEN